MFFQLLDYLVAVSAWWGFDDDEFPPLVDLAFALSKQLGEDIGSFVVLFQLRLSHCERVLKDPDLTNPLLPFVTANHSIGIERQLKLPEFGMVVKVRTPFVDGPAQYLRFFFQLNDVIIFPACLEVPHARELPVLFASDHELSHSRSLIILLLVYRWGPLTQRIQIFGCAASFCSLPHHHISILHELSPSDSHIGVDGECGLKGDLLLGDIERHIKFEDFFESNLVLPF